MPGLPGCRGTNTTVLRGVSEPKLGRGNLSNVDRFKQNLRDRVGEFDLPAMKVWLRGQRLDLLAFCIMDRALIVDGAQGQ
jgi:hypothetical protein